MIFSQDISETPWLSGKWFHQQSVVLNFVLISSLLQLQLRSSQELMKVTGKLLPTEHDIGFVITPIYYMTVSHKDWELPNSRI